MMVFRVLFIGLVMMASSLFLSAEDLKPERIHQITTLEVVDKLKRRHYRELSINDQLSQDFLAAYLAALDPNRLIILAAEVEQYQRLYGSKLDNMLLSGDLQAAYDIFNSYRNRVIALNTAILAALPQTIASFDFNDDDAMQLDRSEASWPASQAEVNQLAERRLKAAVLSLRLADKSNEEITELLSKRYQNQADRLSKLNSEDVYQAYINAYTQLYDPHTNYLSPVSSENFDISMSLKLEGIGAMLSSKDEFTSVVRLIHAGPAFKQGELKPSDRITAVGQGDKELVDIVGWRLDEVVKLIRGPKGSKVRLEVIPASAVSDEERKLITIVRDEVKLEEQSVQKAMIDVEDSNGIVHKFGVLDIPAFYIDFEALRKRDPNYRSTTRDTAKLLSELVNDGAEGIIIDLRNNGGGSLREANELTGLFIEKGPSVQIRLSDKKTYTEAKQYFSPYYDGPLIVLVNRMSASASEIFAGAMQDYKRALIIGSPSFGKGTVQSLTPMNHGKLKITESKFYRISGESTQHRGVVPDILLPKIYNSELVGESSLDHALAWDSIGKAAFNEFDKTSALLPQLIRQSQRRVKSQPDFQYFNEKLAYEQSLDIDFLSLNLKERKRLREDDKAKRLAIENKLRLAKGEKPLASLDDKSDEAEQETSTESLGNAIDIDDAYLQESANVLLDFIAAQKSVKTVSR